LRSRLALAGFMVVAGSLHFVIPRSYERIVPRLVGSAEVLVAATGVAEIGAGVLLAVPRTRRVGAWLTVALLVLVWPANWKMALDGGLPGGGPVTDNPLVAWLRVPLQLPLIAWAYRHTRPATST
jgi:uncharacterized membrane protein